MFTTLRANSSKSSSQVSTWASCLVLPQVFRNGAWPSPSGALGPTANAIASAGAAAIVAARLHDVHAVPVLGYIAQMRPVPRRVKNFGKEAFVRNLEGSWELVWSL